MHPFAAEIRLGYASLEVLLVVRSHHRGNLRCHPTFQPVEAKLLGSQNVAISTGGGENTHTVVLQLAAICNSTEVPHSDRAIAGSVNGSTHSRVTVACDLGYANTKGSSTCLPDGNFSAVVCEPVQCPAGSAGTNVLTGDCLCERGYSGAVGNASAAVPFHTGPGCVPIPGVAAVAGSMASDNLGMAALALEYTGFKTMLVSSLGANVVMLASGPAHLVFMTSDGRVFASGLNDRGQVGDGTTTERKTPIVVLDGIAQVAAGFCHTVYLRVNGTVLAAGCNAQFFGARQTSAGQLGIGGSLASHWSAPNDQLTPVAVPGAGSDVASIAAGRAHTLYLKRNGTLYGVGDNRDNQLGMYAGHGWRGFINLAQCCVVLSPVEIYTAGSDNVAVTAGNAHTVLLKADGRVWGVGFGRWDGGTSLRSYPRFVELQLAGAGNLVVGCSGYSMLQVKVDGTAFGNLDGFGASRDYTCVDGQSPHWSTENSAARGVQPGQVVWAGSAVAKEGCQIRCDREGASAFNVDTDPSNPECRCYSAAAAAAITPSDWPLGWIFCSECNSFSLPFAAFP